MIHDLHSHSTFSDGLLSPRELIARAVEKNVGVLAITDHDTMDAYQDLPAPDDGIRVLPGIEFSTQLGTTGIHVLGLNVDVNSEALSAGVRFQTNARFERARKIGENLAKKGISDAFAGAAKLAQGAYIGRPHFAQYLVDTGKVKTMHAAFKHYMGDGKAGDVKQHWAELSQIIDWIRDANGIAVLAHPLKYKLTRTKLKCLLDKFLQSGGQGMEVISGQQLPQQTSELAQLCEHKKLLASCGSDFHGPGKPWAQLGTFARLPKSLIPVWDRF